MGRSVLAAYTGSAHGVPERTDDLKALLPRYLELLAEGQEPCQTGNGVALMRFGDALRAKPDLYNGEQWAACMAWMDAFIRATVANDGSPKPVAHDIQASQLIPLLVCGGFPAPEVTRILGEALLGSGAPMKALAQFATDVGDCIVGAGPQLGLDWFSLRYVPRSEVEVVVDWLNDPMWRAPLAAAAASPMPWDDSTEYLKFQSAIGAFHADHFPQDSWFGAVGPDNRFAVSFPPRWEVQFEASYYKALAPDREGHVRIFFIPTCPPEADERETLLRRLVGAAVGETSSRTARSLFGEGGFVSEVSDDDGWRLVHFAPADGSALVAVASHRGKSPGHLRNHYVGAVNFMRCMEPTRWPRWRPLDGEVDYPLTAIAAVDGETVCASEESLRAWLAHRAVHAAMLNVEPVVLFEPTGRRVRAELKGEAVRVSALEWIQWPRSEEPHGSSR